MLTADLRVFLYNWLRAPLQTGAFMPSSGPLVRTMAAQLDPGHDGFVVELGAGTGVVTRALLERGVHAERLVVIERSPEFCRLVGRKFPEIAVVRGDAQHLRHLLHHRGVGQVSAVVSSLPLLSLPFSTQRDILRESVQVLEPGGVFVQFTYGTGSPVQPGLVRRLGLDGRPVARVWRNLPPAVVWCYRTGASSRGTSGKMAA